MSHPSEAQDSRVEIGEVRRSPASQLSRPSSALEKMAEQLGHLLGGQSEIIRSQSELKDNVASLTTRMDRLESPSIAKLAVGSELNPGDGVTGTGMAMAAFYSTAAGMDRSALGLQGKLDDVRFHSEPLGYPGSLRRSERLSNKPRPDYTVRVGKLAWYLAIQWVRILS